MKYMYNMQRLQKDIPVLKCRIFLVRFPSGNKTLEQGKFTLVAGFPSILCLRVEFPPEISPKSRISPRNLALSRFLPGNLS